MIDDTTPRQRCCCNCDHRMADKWHCDIDGHYIGYVECFEGWCHHWTDKKYNTLFNAEGEGGKNGRL